MSINQYTPKVQAPSYFHKFGFKGIYLFFVCLFFWKHEQKSYTYQLRIIIYAFINTLFTSTGPVEKVNKPFQNVAGSKLYKNGLLILEIHTVLKNGQKQPFADVFQNRLQHRCFSVNIAKFLRTAFLIEHPKWLFLRGNKERKQDFSSKSIFSIAD